MAAVRGGHGQTQAGGTSGRETSASVWEVFRPEYAEYGEELYVEAEDSPSSQSPLESPCLHSASSSVRTAISYAPTFK